MTTILSLFTSKTELYYITLLILLGSSLLFTLLCIPGWIIENMRKSFWPKMKYTTVFYTVFAWAICSNKWASDQKLFITKAVLYAPLVGLSISYLGFLVKEYSRSKSITYGWYILMPAVCGFLLTRI